MDKQIEFVENYLQWVNDNKLDPPKFSPEEYAFYLNNLNNQKLIDEIIKVIDSGEDATKLIDSITVILKNKIEG